MLLPTACYCSSFLFDAVAAVLLSDGCCSGDSDVPYVLMATTEGSCWLGADLFGELLLICLVQLC